VRKHWEWLLTLHLASEARQIQRPFAFQPWGLARDDQAVETGHRLQNRLGLDVSDLADECHALAETLLPELAIGVEHDFDSLRVMHSGHEGRSAVALQLDLQPPPEYRGVLCQVSHGDLLPLFVVSA
jgi:hypothetical protein